MVPISAPPVVLARMLTLVRMQATRPRRGPTLAVKSWSLPSLSPVIPWCLLNSGTELVFTTSVLAVPILMTVFVTRWRPTRASAEQQESSCSGGARLCVVSKSPESGKYTLGCILSFHIERACRQPAVSFITNFKLSRAQLFKFWVLSSFHLVSVYVLYPEFLCIPVFLMFPCVS